MIKTQIDAPRTGFKASPEEMEKIIKWAQYFNKKISVISKDLQLIMKKARIPEDTIKWGFNIDFTGSPYLKNHELALVVTVIYKNQPVDFTLYGTREPDGSLYLTRDTVAVEGGIKAFLFEIIAEELSTRKRGPKS